MLVVCGSLNEHARDELATLVDRGITLGIAGDDLAALTNAMERNHHAILTTDAPIHRPVSFEDAQQAVQALARATQELSSLALTIVIVGGDTAAAVLGNGVQTVGGLVAYGTPWCVPHDNGPLIVTRSGGFGAAITLEQLLFGKLGL